MIPETMADWVELANGSINPDEPLWGASLTAERMKTVDLFMAHSEATVKLVGVLSGEERKAWKEALKATCEEIAVRLDKARGALDDVPAWRRR